MIKQYLYLDKNNNPYPYARLMGIRYEMYWNECRFKGNEFNPSEHPPTFNAGIVQHPVSGDWTVEIVDDVIPFTDQFDGQIKTALNCLPENFHNLLIDEQIMRNSGWLENEQN
jgi:hypothetical protein